MTIQRLIEQCKNGTAHHAYVVRGIAHDTIIRECIAHMPVGTVFVHTAPALVVGDARIIRDRATRATNTHHIILVAVQTCTEQAQNALLKTLEEPQPGTHVVLAVPHSCRILDTVRSRCIEVTFSLDGDDKESHQKSLIDYSYKERKKLIAKILTDDDTAVKASAFVEHELSVAYHAGLRLQITQLNWALELLRQPGVSHKLILEHLIATM